MITHHGERDPESKEKELQGHFTATIVDQSKILFIDDSKMKEVKRIPPAYICVFELVSEQVSDVQPSNTAVLRSRSPIECSDRMSLKQVSDVRTSNTTFLRSRSPIECSSSPVQEHTLNWEEIQQLDNATIYSIITDTKASSAEIVFQVPGYESITRECVLKHLLADQYVHAGILDMALQLLVQHNSKFLILPTTLYEDKVLEKSTLADRFISQLQTENKSVIIFPTCKASHYQLVVIDTVSKTLLGYCSMNFSMKDTFVDVRKVIGDLSSTLKWDIGNLSEYSAEKVKFPKQKEIACGIYVYIFARGHVQGNIEESLKQLQTEQIQQAREEIAGNLVRASRPLKYNQYIQ